VFVFLWNDSLIECRRYYTSLFKIVLSSAWFKAFSGLVSCNAGKLSKFMRLSKFYCRMHSISNFNVASSAYFIVFA
jgi:hypothetical protein